VPRFLIFLQHFLDDIYQNFIGGLSQPISMRVIGCGLSQSDLVLTTKLYQLFLSERCCIISDNIFGASKTRENIIFQEFYNHDIYGLPRSNNFNPLCEVFYSCEDPLMIA
jgi:hypothetical protein